MESFATVRELLRGSVNASRGWAPAILAASLASNAHGAAPAATLADDRVEASYNAGGQFVHDAALDQLLARVAKRVQAANPDAACVPLRVHALDVPLPYAFVLNNGAFYLSTSLIARLQSEAEFAALVAMPLAALCRGDADKLKADERQRVLNNFVPNLLLITLTAGLGAPSITKSNAQHRAEEGDRLRNASDALALRWLAIAGYDPTAARLAITHLLEGLAAEDRSGVPEFSDPVALTSRRDALERTLAQTASEGAATPPTPDAAPTPGAGTTPDAAPTPSAAPAANAAPVPTAAKDPFRLASRRYAQMLARADLESHPTGFTPWLDHIDALDGPTGYTAYLRAEFIRRNSAADAAIPAAVAAYERCVSFADAPTVAYRELGFLYRRAGDSTRARAALSKYLQLTPAAVDAPIIRTYLETP